MTPREVRLLNQLVINEKVFVKDLRARIGALNPPQIALQVRRKGWGVKTGRITVFDRDGNLCHPGYYYFEPQERERAHMFLMEAGRAAATAQTGNILEQENSMKYQRQDSRGDKK